MKLTVDQQAHDVSIEHGSVTVDGRSFSAAVEGEGAARAIVIDGRTYRVELPDALQSPLTVIVEGRAYQVEVEGLRSTPRSLPAPPPPPRAVEPGAVTARMAGRIVRVEVEAGERVQEGDLLLILEAMKMENEIHAPYAGTVARVVVSAGQRVTESETLVVIEAG